VLRGALGRRPLAGLYGDRQPLLVIAGDFHGDFHGDFYGDFYGYVKIAIENDHL